MIKVLSIPWVTCEKPYQYQSTEEEEESQQNIVKKIGIDGWS